MPKDEWKDVVYEAVESSEDAALTARLAQMKGNAAARYARIKLWDKLPAELATMKGEVGRRGAQVPERYLDSRAEPVGTRLKLMCRLGRLPTMVRIAREEMPEMGACKMRQGRGGRAPYIADLRRLRQPKGQDGRRHR